MSSYLLRLPRLTVNGAELRYTSFTNVEGVIWHEAINGHWVSPQPAHHFTIQDADRPPLHVYAYRHAVTWDPVPSMPAEIHIIGGALDREQHFVPER